MLAVLLASAGLAAGCGTKEEETVVVDDPVAEALAHAPASAAVLAVVATDRRRGPGAALAALAQRFPGNELALAQGAALLGERLGLDPEDELEPLLGNPVVLWSPDGSAARRSAAWVVRDGGRLGELLAARVKAGALRAEGASGEYALYARRDGGAYARRGPVLVTAPDLPALREALARRRAGSGQWAPELLRERSLGLPGGAVARVVLDAGALTRRSLPGLSPVRWVAGLRRAALTLTPLGGGLRLHARAGLEGVGAADGPLAPGVEPPRVRGSAPIVVGVRDPQQTLRFARRVTDLLDPDRLEGLRRTEEVLRRYARVDLEEDLLDRITGTATLTTRPGGGLTLRADLDDPERVADALTRVERLAKLAGPLAGLAGVDLGGLDVEEDDGTSRLTQDGRLLVALRVQGGALVATTDPGTDLRAAGDAPPGPPAPTAGALRATATAELVQEQLAQRLRLPAFLRGVLTPLGGAIVTARGEAGSFDLQVVLPVRGG